MIKITKIDWNEAWKEVDRMKRADDKMANCTDRWNDPERCRKFNQRIQAENWKDSWDRIRAMQVTPGSRVLDIGAGPGTLAVPLSGIVRHVTAVEPSTGMLECLHGHIQERQIRNITTVQKKWEDIDPGSDLDAPYDVVVASYSLGVPDLRDALEKIDLVSSKYAYIFWFADMMSPRLQNYLEIWEDLFGKPPLPRYSSNIIFNLLNQMGIYANVEVTRMDHVTRFSSMEDAVSSQRYDLDLKDDRQVSVLRAYLEKTLKQENGDYILERQSYQAKIWWDKEIQAA